MQAQPSSPNLLLFPILECYSSFWKKPYLYVEQEASLKCNNLLYAFYMLFANLFFGKILLFQRNQHLFKEPLLFQPHSVTNLL